MSVTYPFNTSSGLGGYGHRNCRFYSTKNGETFCKLRKEKCERDSDCIDWDI